MSIDTITILDYWMIILLFLVGSLLHFTYDMTKHNKWVSVFSAVNESYWEHIKIVFWPLFLLYFVEFIIGGYEIASFIPAKTIALYSVPVSMIAMVFAYKYFTKKNVLALDIIAFLLTIVVAQVISSLMLSELNPSLWSIGLSCIFLFIIMLAFMIFTKHPPKEPDLFKDPITSKYGLKGHK